ncbi:MAG: hypothetical protein JWO49_887 [Arthrobacter sp.]|nr:hypothetical protein [Arthrobacter sp.]
MSSLGQNKGESRHRPGGEHGSGTARRGRLIARIVGFGSIASLLGILLLGCADPPAAATPRNWVDEGRGLSLHLNTDGTLLAFDGCNTKQGTWSGEGSHVELLFDGGTERGCSDVDVWLSLARTAEADGEVLRLSDAKGVVLGELVVGE